MDNYYAVVLGLTPTGLYAIRELGREGVPVVGVDLHCNAGRWSRYLTFEERSRIAGSPPEALEWLLALGERFPKRGVLLPTSDPFIELIAANAERLRELFKFQDSYDPESYRRIVDKARFYRLCRDHGLAAPGLWVVAGDKLPSLGSEASLPCIVKPTLIHRVYDLMAGKKVFVIEERGQFAEVARKVEGADTKWLVQEVVPGPESNITLFGGYFDRAGRLHQPFTCVKVRQYPPGFGSASLVRARDLPETLRLSRQFLQDIGFHGIAGTEFKYDPRDDKLKVIEINPRSTLWFAASSAAGKRIALAAFRDQAGLPLPEEERQANDIAWRFLLKDLYSQLWYRLKGGDFVLPPPDVSANYPAGVRRTVGAVWDARDPAPALAEFGNYARKFFQSAASRQ